MVHLSRPIRGIIPTLDAPVIEALAGTTRSLSGREVHRLAGAGSDRGVRLVLQRLAREGLVLAEPHAGSILYRANRDHLAWPAVAALVGLRSTLITRLRERIGGWTAQPVHASVFGSAARGDADQSSDLDLLLVRPDGAGEAWDRQVDELRAWVMVATGNPCQAFETDRAGIATHVAEGDPLVDAWRRDGVHLAGISIEELIRSARRARP